MQSGVTAAQSVFDNRMIEMLGRTAPNIDSAKVLGTGASDIGNVFQGADLVAVRAAYIVGIKDVFAFSMAGAAFTVVLSLFIPFTKLPSHDSPDPDKGNGISKKKAMDSSSHA